ncbi:MAG: AraC family transcriptional regulator [Nibricoccus sp.]
MIPLVEWSYLHAHLIWIYDGVVEPEGRRGTADAPYLTAWLLRAGKVELKVNNKRYAAKAGEWIFPPPGLVWRNFSEDARILSVRFRVSWPGGEDLFASGQGVSLVAAEHPELERAARALAVFVKRRFSRPDIHLLNAPATLATHLRLQALFARWLDVSINALALTGLVPSRMGHIDGRVLRAVQLIERHNLATPFSERAVAGELSLSVSQLNRLFVRQYGVSMHGFFERRRCEYAVAALQGSARSVKEVAFELGFSSLAHFSGWARKRLGHSPRAIRSLRERNGKINI